MLLPVENKKHLPLPTEVDFDPAGGSLDALWAWKNFGGLSLENAIQKFNECPVLYHEDFMFMGPKAFAHYFDVIDTFLRNTPSEYDGDDRHAWILACCLANQFSERGGQHLMHLKDRAVALGRFVLQNITRFECDRDAQQRIAEAWTTFIKNLEPDAN